MVKLDLGATYEGTPADAATTVICEKAKDSKHTELVNLCKKAFCSQFYLNIQRLQWHCV